MTDSNTGSMGGVVESNEANQQQPDESDHVSASPELGGEQKAKQTFHNNSDKSETTEQHNSDIDNKCIADPEHCSLDNEPVTFADEDIDKKQQQYNFDDVKNLFTGTHHNVHYHQYSADPSTSNQSTHREFPKAQPANFPKIQQELPFTELENLDKKIEFLKENRWIVLKPSCDSGLISDAIALLLRDFNESQYLIQKGGVNCDDYIKHSKVFYSYVQSVIKLVINKDQVEALTEFFETREESQLLSSQLREGKNFLVIYVRDSRSSDKLKSVVTQNNHSPAAYWEFSLILKNDDELVVNTGKLDWLESIVVTLCCWLNGISYQLLNKIIEQILSEKLSQTPFIPEGDNTKFYQYQQWQTSWTDNPYEVLAKVSIVQKPDDEGIYALRFKESGLKAFYRKECYQQSLIQLCNTLPYIESAIFELSTDDLNKHHPYIIESFVKLLTKLDSVGMFNLNSAYLQDLYDKHRFAANSTAEPVSRFFNLIKELYLHNSTTSLVVEEYLELHARALLNHADSLYHLANKDFKRIYALPAQMQKLRYQASQFELANHFFYFRDRALALLILFKEIGLSEIKAISLIDRFLRHIKNTGHGELLSLNFLLPMQHECNHHPVIINDMLSAVEQYSANNGDDNYHYITQWAEGFLILHFKMILNSKRASASLDFLLNWLMLKTGYSAISRLVTNDTAQQLTHIKIMLGACERLAAVVIFHHQIVANNDEQNAHDDNESLFVSEFKLEMAKLLSSVASAVNYEKFKSAKGHWLENCGEALDSHLSLDSTMTDKEKRIHDRLVRKTNKKAYLLIKKNFVRTKKTGK